MPPKKNLALPSALGGVVPHKDGHRVRVYIDGLNRYGPRRDTQAEAHEDLRQAQATNTRDEYAAVLRQLQAAARAAAPAGASAAGPASAPPEAGAVNIFYYESRQRWQIQWWSSGAKCQNISTSALDGDKDAAERVAQRVKTLVENARDRSDKSAFREQIDEYIAEELGQITSVAASSDNTAGGDGGHGGVTVEEVEEEEEPAAKRRRLETAALQSSLESIHRFEARRHEEAPLSAEDLKDLKDHKDEQIARLNELLCAAGAGSNAGATSAQAQSSRTPQSIALPGLNFQWPWSRLVLAGVKDETRTYELGFKGICQANQETWIVETPGSNVAAEDVAVLDGIDVGKRPDVASIIGTVTFSHDEQYKNIDEFRGDVARHRIRRGCRWDWDGETGSRYAWRVAHTRRLCAAIPQPGRKSTTGFSKPREHTVNFVD